MTGVPGGVTGPTGDHGGRRWAILAVLCVTLLLVSLDTTVLNVALPSIVVDLRATSSDLQWVVDAYAIVFASLLLTLGALGDRVGRKWVFMAGLVVFAGGSAAAAWSGSPVQLTAARAVMGVGAAALMPGTLSILTNVFVTQRDRARAIGIWSATAGIGVAIGPILGGFLLDRYWWGSVFLINVPIAAAGLLAAALLVPNSRNPEGKRSDPLGSLLSMGFLGLLLWAIIEAPARGWASAGIIGAFAGSAVLLAAFVVWEVRSTHPMLPMRFFRNRRYSVAIGAMCLVMFGLLGMFFVITQYFQFVLGFTPLQAGLGIGPVALVLLAAAPTSILLVHRFGNRWVIGAGLILIAAGLLLLSRTTIESTYADNLPAFILAGIGVGLALAPSTESVMGSLPRAEAGVGSATSDTSIQVGGALGVAVLGTALTLRYQDLLTPQLAGLPLPEAARVAVLGSLGGALEVARALPAQAGAALSEAARTAFVSGMDLGLLVAATAVAIAGVVVLLVLPHRGLHPDEPDEESEPNGPGEA